MGRFLLLLSAGLLLVSTAPTASRALLLRQRGPGRSNVTEVAAAAVASVPVGEEKHPHRSPSEPFRQRLTNFGNAQYYGDFRIGGQVQQGIFDTGSFDILVMSKECERCLKAGRKDDYDSALSKTYEKEGTRRQHVFGSGPALSELGYEQIEVGPIVAKRQEFYQIIDHGMDVLDKARFSAIFGMGLGPGPSHGGEPKEDGTFLGSVNMTEFAVCFTRGNGLPKDNPGWLIWGPVAREFVRRGGTGEFAKIPVIGVHHWAVQLGKVATDTMPPMMAGGICSSGCAAIVDSGTSLIAAPYTHLMALSQFIGQVKEDCSNMDQLPTLILKLGDGQEFRLPPRAYILRISGAYMEASSVWEVLMFKPRIRNVKACIPAFMQINLVSQLGPVWILGMPYFRYFHTTFDRTRKELQVATAEKDCSWSSIAEHAGQDKPPKQLPAGPLLAAKKGASGDGGASEAVPRGAAGGVASGELRVRATTTVKAEDLVPTDVDISAVLPPALSVVSGTPDKPAFIDL